MGTLALVEKNDILNVGVKEFRSPLDCFNSVIFQM